MTKRVSAADHERIELLVEKYGAPAVIKLVETSAKNEAKKRRAGRPRNYAPNSLAVWAHVEYWRESSTRTSSKKKTVEQGCNALLKILQKFIVDQDYTFGTLKRWYYEANKLRNENSQTKRETDTYLRHLRQEIASSRSHGNLTVPVPQLLKVTEDVFDAPIIDRLGKADR